MAIDLAERTPEWKAARAAWEQQRPQRCPCGHPWASHNFVDLAIAREGRVDQDYLAFMVAERLARWMVTCDGTPPDASEERGPWSYVCPCTAIWTGAARA